MHSPGHTLASITVVVGDAAFVHDTLFMPDSGTARCDFPGGDAARLWRSIQRILALPDGTRVFTGHDYGQGGREPRWESTVAEQRATNTHMVAAGSEEAFVAVRKARDATLPMPNLILHALQVNIRGGRLPEPEANGRRYLKIPLDAFKEDAFLTEELTLRIGEALKVLANPNRLRIAFFLLQGERSVAEIERELGIRQPTLSQQLGELREVGFVSTRREHKSVFYRVTDPRRRRTADELRRIYSVEPGSLPAIRAAPTGRARSQQAAMFGLVGDRA